MAGIEELAKTKIFWRFFYSFLEIENIFKKM